ncbi:hypothetical protein ACT453_09340, partial [Bacillus sp. D-CC]
MKKVLLSIVSGAVLLLGACSGGSDKEVKALDEKKITVGVTGGPHEQIYTAISKSIDNKKLKEGCKIPSETELMK